MTKKVAHDRQQERREEAIRSIGEAAGRRAGESGGREEIGARANYRRRKLTVNIRAYTRGTGGSSLIGPIRGNSWRLLISLSLRLRAQCHAAGQPTWISSLRGDQGARRGTLRRSRSRIDRHRLAGVRRSFPHRRIAVESRGFSSSGETERVLCTFVTIVTAVAVQAAECGFSISYRIRSVIQFVRHAF